jgi:hypothetical protein
MRFLTVCLAGMLVSSTALSQSQLSCTAFVYGEMPFVTIEMTVKDDGHIERLANLIHQGTSRQTALVENAVRDDQLYNLTVDADHPGQELFLEIYKPANGDNTGVLNAKLINPSSPAYKTMRTQCK